jgi:hypothetical protein
VTCHDDLFIKHLMVPCQPQTFIGEWGMKFTLMMETAGTSETLIFTRLDGISLKNTVIFMTWLGCSLVHAFSTGANFIPYKGSRHVTFNCSNSPASCHICNIKEKRWYDKIWYYIFRQSPATNYKLLRLACIRIIIMEPTAGYILHCCK